jgi:hypothetical protein
MAEPVVYSLGEGEIRAAVALHAPSDQLFYSGEPEYQQI